MVIIVIPSFFWLLLELLTSKSDTFTWGINTLHHLMVVGGDDTFRVRNFGTVISYSVMWSSIGTS